MHAIIRVAISNSSEYKPSSMLAGFALAALLLRGPAASVAAQPAHSILSAGCGLDPPFTPAAGRSEWVNLEVDGWERGFLLQLPAGYRTEVWALL
jgi:hypothetical protein